MVLVVNGIPVFAFELKNQHTGQNADNAKTQWIISSLSSVDVVRKLIVDVRENGAGKNYLIQHSAGSGKSNSIAWTAYRFASLIGGITNQYFSV